MSKIFTIKKLQSNKFWHEIPAESGVYVVVYKKHSKSAFLKKGTGGKFKGNNPNVSIERLNKKWVDFKQGEEKIIYIGKSNNLRRRIRAYIKFGLGKPVAKRGGRLIWQIADSDSLEVYWKTNKMPRETEKKMLLEFEKRHGKLPFANLIR
jgi:excinuclease UvrABC nuclease subunit